MMNDIMGIYKITNKQNGAVYIGKSKNIFERWTQHIDNALKSDMTHGCFDFYHAIRQYGPENFTFEILEVLGNSYCWDKQIDETLLKLENEYIDKFDTERLGQYNHKYNSEFYQQLNRLSTNAEKVKFHKECLEKLLAGEHEIIVTHKLSLIDLI